MNNAQHKRLIRLLSQPTAPFREQHVIREIETQLARTHIPYFFDPHGNLVLGVASKQEYLKRLQLRKREPVRLFIAHMDHPGFHAVRWLSATRLLVKWHGGTPVKHVNGRKVWLADAETLLGQGVIRKSVRHTGYATLVSSEVVVDRRVAERLRRTKVTSLFGAFEFSQPVWCRGKRLYTRAADDLVGVFSIIETARKLFHGKTRADVPFIGLLTRAEEVGFVGAVAHFELGWLQRATRPVVAVSLEASRNLPGAVIGKGPIVRLGDRRTVFNADALQVFTELAERVLRGRYQRRVMDGGACEATAATAWGISTIGLTLPLGNYHNQGLDGGAECPQPLGPAPEYVHLDDIDGELLLCRALMREGLPWQQAWQGVQERLRRNRRRYAKLLTQ
jgi:putative aminopeptidase FrvX